jgi:energy-coupling factor transporter ATP-binding protein EcfA2
MLQEVRFINYRGLKNTTIPLVPITLLTGMNGIGKTSVLEGLYFLLSPHTPNPTVFSRLPPIWKDQNSSGSFSMQSPSFSFKYDYLSFWNGCPTNGVAECEVVAVLNDENTILVWEAKLSDYSGLYFKLKDTVGNYNFPKGAGIPYVSWEWYKYVKNNDDKNFDIQESSRAAQQLSTEPNFTSRSGTISPTICRYVNMSFGRSSNNTLSLKTEKLLTRALAIINPDITGVRHDGSSGWIRVIINDELYPLSVMGFGAETLANMLLTLEELPAESTGHELSVMFLIDEVGAGIHYSKLENVWRFLFEFASEYPQIQMVLTTHSHDCINAFCKTFHNANPSMAHIVRMHKFDETDGVSTTIYPQEMFASILSGEWEVRG